MMEATAPMARVKLDRSPNAKQNGITIELVGLPGELAALVDTAYIEFGRAVEKMKTHEPQQGAK